MLLRKEETKKYMTNRINLIIYVIYKQGENFTKHYLDHHQVRIMVAVYLADGSNNRCCQQASAILQYIPSSSQDSNKVE